MVVARLPAKAVIATADIYQRGTGKLFTLAGPRLPRRYSTKKESERSWRKKFHPLPPLLAIAVLARRSTRAKREPFRLGSGKVE
jgi:hypothetical protein